MLEVRFCKQTCAFLWKCPPPPSTGNVTLEIKTINRIQSAVVRRAHLKSLDNLITKYNWCPDFLSFSKCIYIFDLVVSLPQLRWPACFPSCVLWCWDSLTGERRESSTRQKTKRVIYSKIVSFLSLVFPLWLHRSIPKECFNQCGPWHSLRPGFVFVVAYLKPEEAPFSRAHVGIVRTTNFLFFLRADR